MGTTLTHGMVVPKAIRCAHCGALAREEIRERLSDEEVVVRYGCSDCRAHYTRHYNEEGAEVHGR